MGDQRHEVLDAIGRRWAPRIIHELAGGALGFNELRKRCDNMSPSVLSTRLRDLRGVGLADHDDFDSWELTDDGYRWARAIDQALSS